MSKKILSDKNTLIFFIPNGTEHRTIKKTGPENRKKIDLKGTTELRNGDF